MMLLLLALAVCVAVLWQRVRTLVERVRRLEASGTSVATSSWNEEPSADHIATKAADPFSAIWEPVRREKTEQGMQPEDRLEAYDEVLAVADGGLVADTMDHLDADRPLMGRTWSFEDIFGRRLPIWAGGITLAVAGFLIVRLSIAAGLLAPPVRIVLGLLFGSALIVSAEAALRFSTIVRDERVRQALAGAGIATLYAMVLAAANLYGLIGGGMAFAGMILITGLAGGLSIRFGAPSAVLGLVGGLAAPALIGSSEPNVPLLTLYLSLTIASLCMLGRQQRWWWLGAAALAGGFGWGLLLILHEALDFASTLSVGIYTLALAVGLPLLLTGERAVLLRLLGALMGCAQLAALIAVGGFSSLDWGLFGLISVALVWLSRREKQFADVPALGLCVAILLGIAWPHPTVRDLTFMLIGLLVIYGGAALRRVWRADVRRTDAPSAAAVALAIGFLPAIHFASANTAFSAVIGAALAGGTAGLGWSNVRRSEDSRFATLSITVAILLGFAGLKACPEWLWPPVMAAVTSGLFELGWRARDRRIGSAGWAFCAVTLGTLAASSGTFRLIGIGEQGDFTALLTWAVPAFLAAFLAWRADTLSRRLLQPAAVVIGYGAAAQFLPLQYVPLAPVAIVATLACTRRADLLPGLCAGALLMAGWSLVPLGHWLVPALGSLAGISVYFGEWPSFMDIALRVAAPGLALIMACLCVPVPQRLRDGALVAAGLALMISAHVAYKHVFVIDGPGRFVAFGLAERTLWEMLLAGGAIAACYFRARLVGLALASATLMHFAWFTGVIANPLWVHQDVGLWLLLAYATAGGLLWLVPHVLPRFQRQRDWALMVLILFGAFTTLRQIMHTTLVLSDGTGPGEQIGRSVLAIALAGGFLWTGIARHLRDWRIASLGLMLVAVAKVFLFDASGLDGLARIASFGALGFSLIGVGWLYSRYLPNEDRQGSSA